jgi:hypothetical protein
VSEFYGNSKDTAKKARKGEREKEKGGKNKKFLEPERSPLNKHNRMEREARTKVSKPEKSKRREKQEPKQNEGKVL